MTCTAIKLNNSLIYNYCIQFFFNSNFFFGDGSLRQAEG